MQKQISPDNTLIHLTGQDMINMDWNLTNSDQPADKFILWIDLQKQVIRISPDPEGDFLSGWEFDYTETLQDLYGVDLLPGGIMRGNSLYYNDLENSTSECIQHGAVGDICGMSMIEVRAFTSLDHLNQVITTNFSITAEPVFDLIEE